MIDTDYPAPAPGAVKRCPACRLPITAATLGNAVAASSDDHHHHVVVAICRRCASSASRIPAHAYRKLLNRAADRALADHDRYLCTHVADAGAARLAVGLLGHPAHVLEALDALGWGAGVDRTEKSL
ncbi:MAG: hypothetical protein ACLGHA_05705 [Gammaproteobacteria bacterium]